VFSVKDGRQDSSPGLKCEQIMKQPSWRGGRIGIRVLTLNLLTSNDGWNWVNRAVVIAPIAVPVTVNFQPNDSGAYFKFSYSLNGGGVVGGITAVTYGMFANLKDT